MPSIKEYNRKIGSLKNTVKITKTMKMVSAAKLRRAQDAQRQAADFAREVNELIHLIASNIDVTLHPLLQPRESVKKVLVLGYTSDKGLCGGFNNNLIRFLGRWKADQEANGLEVDLAFAGKRGNSYYTKRANVVKNYEDVTAVPDARNATKIAADLEHAFLEGGYDEVYLLNNKFESALVQTPTMQKILPMEPADLDTLGDQFEEERNGMGLDFIIEPPPAELLNELVPRLVTFKVLYALLENSAGEHGARMTSMDNATTNAMDMIDSYTLLRNRARQAAITTELTEIISGAEAL